MNNILDRLQGVFPTYCPELADAIIQLRECECLKIKIPYEEWMKWREALINSSGPGYWDEWRWLRDECDRAIIQEKEEDNGRIFFISLWTGGGDIDDYYVVCGGGSIVFEVENTLRGWETLGKLIIGYLFSVKIECDKTGKPRTAILYKDKEAKEWWDAFRYK